MKKQKKILALIIVFITILLSSCKVFAADLSEKVDVQISDNFIEWLKQSDTEKDITTMPRMYDIPKTKTTLTNPLKFARMLGSSNSLTEFSLKDIISENMVVKDQKSTNSCWTFASLAALESNLALKDHKNNLAPIVYDFSERHMEYATARTLRTSTNETVVLNNAFKDGTNEKGFNRSVDDGGNSWIFIPYLTNGTGAVDEKDLPFKENNKDVLSLSDINKTVIAQVNDIVTLPSYSSTDTKTEIIQQMKDHIKNYGAIYAGIHGVGPIDSKCYNSEHSAIYCNHDKIPSQEGHAVAIVGWDDEFSKENFVQKPKNDGAWIIRNSWGTEIVEKYNLLEMKELIFRYYPDVCARNNWTVATDIPDDVAIAFFTEIGYTIIEENKETFATNTTKVGDEGFMYISYEDYHIYSELVGIEDAQEVAYDNLYQYDEFGGIQSATMKFDKIYLATIFDRKTQKTEYLTQVSIMAPEKYTCKVYVNPNGTSKSMNDLQQVNLKSGDTETFEAGYHTIEFADPIQITGENFVVVLEVDGERSDYTSMIMEFNFQQNIQWFLDVLNAGLKEGEEAYTEEHLKDVLLHIYDNVTLASEKCFFTYPEAMNQNAWFATSNMATLTQGGLPNYDTTIKAFTVSDILESIEITTPPTKTKYLVGEAFDKTGMVVTAKYASGETKEITDYTIANGEEITEGQTSVTISYKGKTATQAIEVVENVLENLVIESAPTKTEYTAGEDFDAEGMLVLAVYSDGTSKTITDYTIKDGKNLKAGQTSVTISYEGKEVAQEITVKANPVTKIEITQEPDKVNYVVGQDFDPKGMKVQVTYENGIVKEVEDYTVEDGKDLKEGQTTVTIKYEDKTATQAIRVEVKAVSSIFIKTKPTKTQYIQNKEQLDLTGGIIEISYNDQTKEEIQMTSTDVTASGFDNKEIGTKTITVTYEQKTAQFDIEIIEEPKPENSKFDSMKGNVTRIRTYNFTDATKDGYTVINVELTDIVKSTVNDRMEYYYYLSSNPKASNIVDWVKVSQLQETSNGISFEIDTSNISNLEEATSAENLYLYVKEVAIRNNIQSEAITSAVELKTENVNVEEYLDGKKVADIDPEAGNGGDSTLAPNEYNPAGKSLVILFVMLAIVVIGRITYLRYKDIEIK